MKVKLFEHVDILSLLEDDHKPIKDLIRKMGDRDLKDSKRLHAFQDFIPLFKTSARAEEAALYDFMKLKDDMRSNAVNGETEHLVIDQLCEEIRETADEHTCMGKIEVLAQIASHHILEEEQQVYPVLREEVTALDLKRMARTYIMAQTDIIATVAH